MPITYTPIRYPGGKTKLYPEVREILAVNKLLGCLMLSCLLAGRG